MRVGVHLPNVGPLCDAGAIREVAAAAEELGFDSVWVNDHLVWDAGHASGHIVCGSAESPPRGDICESFMTMAYVAGFTRRVRIGVTVLVVPIRHPILIAKQVAALDVLSNGRAILGVGVGAIEEELAVFGVPFKRRGRVTDEAIAAMGRLWTEAPASFAGQTLQFDNVSCLPRPVQRPGPPIWIGGNSQRALERTARHGDGWIPWSRTPDELQAAARTLRELRAVAGVERPIVLASQHLVAIGATEADAQATARLTLAARFASLEEGEQRSFVGSPEALARKIAAYASVGVEELILGFISRSANEMLQGLRLFAEGVLPRLVNP